MDAVTEPAAPSEAGDATLDAPPVTAVVVTWNAGSWLKVCLSSLAAQDYPGLEVVVVDAASDQDPTKAITAACPGATVHRLDTNPGFGPAVDQAIDLVGDASFVLVCHDDVALDENAVSVMVEEAYRSNAGIVAPKVVSWDDRRRLLSVGMAADKSGAPAGLVDRGELDQEQHDAVRDIFYAPGGCTLVRTDLFRALGGFDPAIDLLGEDLDLSWRAHVAGARVLVAPAAVVRHREAFDARGVRHDRRRGALEARHRLRTMLTCYSRWHLVRVLPQAALLSLAEMIYALLAGDFAHVEAVAGAWRSNLAHLGEIRANRARLRAMRQVPDSEVRRLQVRGSARAFAFVRGQLGHRDDRIRSMSAAGRDFAGSLRSGPARITAIVWIGIVVVLLVGTRGLLFGHLPGFGDFPEFPNRPWTLFSQWFSGFRNAGLGSEAPAPTAYALLGTAGVVFVGAMSFLRRVLLIGLLPVGIAGAWRMGRLGDSTRSRVATVLVYVAIPLPYNAIATGRWGGLIVWAATPWWISALARASSAPPFDEDDAQPPVRLRRRALRLGLAVAVVTAFVPFAIVLVPLIALGIIVGGLFAGGGRVARSARRVFATAIGASAVAFVLNIPWTFDFLLRGDRWSAFAGVRSVEGRLDPSDLIGFHTGPIGGAAIGAVFLVVAVLPLLIGRAWRFEWAARAWTVAALAWALAWVGQQSWFAHGMGPAEATLAPAGAGLALAAGLGVTAFDVDLPGYRFGWRQLASFLAAAALLVGLVPVVANSVDGRWSAPDHGFDTVLSFLHDEQGAGQFRVLWVGDPRALPVSGWGLRDGVAYATTDHPLPSVEDRWTTSAASATGPLPDSLRIAEAGNTSRLGRLLAPMAIRYIVVPSALAPGDASTGSASFTLVHALDQQLDLQLVPADPSLLVYRNDAWAPQVAALQDGPATAVGAHDFTPAALATDLTGTKPALNDDGYTGASGHVDAGTTVYVANSSSSRWSLSVDGNGMPRQTAFGWANSFAVDRSGNGSLSFKTPITRWLLLIVQIVLWLACMLTLLRWRREDHAAAELDGGPA